MTSAPGLMGWGNPSMLLLGSNRDLPVCYQIHCKSKAHIVLTSAANSGTLHYLESDWGKCSFRRPHGVPVAGSEPAVPDTRDPHRQPMNRPHRTAAQRENHALLY